MNHGLFVALVVSGMLYGTPLAIAALGELLTERSGVLNLGVEGMMLVGAVSGFWISQKIGGPTWFALVITLLISALAGSAMALVHAVMSITLRANQVVSGLALLIFGGSVGLSSYFGQIGNLGGVASRHEFVNIDLFGLKGIPLLGPILFDQSALVYLSWVLAATTAVYLWRTRLGLHLRAVGESPAAADASGINVTAYRYAHTVAGGALAGIAGACYSMAIAPGWTDDVTAGAGWIAIALVIVSFWRPGVVLLGAYVFGIATSLGPTLQARGVHVPSELLSAIPYVLTIVVLTVVSATGAARRFGAPAALALPYFREEG